MCADAAASDAVQSPVRVEAALPLNGLPPHGHTLSCGRQKNKRQGNDLDFFCASNDFNIFVNNCIDYSGGGLGWASKKMNKFINNIPFIIRNRIRLNPRAWQHGSAAGWDGVAASTCNGP